MAWKDFMKQDKRMRNKIMVNCPIFMFQTGNFHLGRFRFFTMKRKNPRVSPLKNNKSAKCMLIFHELCEDQGRTNPKWQQS